MPSALDVAAYILKKCGAMTTMKLQKLVYYCQAWSIVWDDDVMFPEQIEAWDAGPVVRDLWKATTPRFRIEGLAAGNAEKLTAVQKATVDRVLKFYGAKDAQWLSDLTHMEEPWQEARHERGRNGMISLEVMSAYYSSLEPNVPAGS